MRAKVGICVELVAGVIVARYDRLEFLSEQRHTASGRTFKQHLNSLASTCRLAAKLGTKMYQPAKR